MAQTFFLTGSARGLGRSIALAILDAGHQLIATARQPAQLHDLVDRYGDSVLPQALDVTDFAATKRSVQAGIDRFGRLDVVVNNAGFSNVGSVEDMPMDAIVSQYNTNFFGSVHVIKAALPFMREQKSGRIIQISSIGARRATPGAAAYSSSKWAISGFMESLALEVNPLGIKVTSIEPGGMKTDFAEDTSMTILQSNPAYDATVGRTAKMVKSPEVIANYSEPSAIAAVVLKVAELEEPPLRLLLGGKTFEYAKSAEQQRMEADEKWKGLTLEADGA